MRTWSAEELFIRAYSAAALTVQGLLDAVHTVEQMTRPVRRDVRDGAEELAEREAEDECSEPHPYRLADWELELLATSRPTAELLHDGATAIGWWLEDKPVPGHPARTRDYWRLAEIELRKRAKDLDADTPNPTEPSLTPDELIGVRGLLQERYEDTPSTSAAGAVGDQIPGGLQHSPPLPARDRPPWSDLADALVEHRPSAKVARQLCLNEHELWAAAHYVDNWSASDNCSDSPHHQEYLRKLALRLRDASRAMRDQQ
jgi:hypothetical protein